MANTKVTDLDPITSAESTDILPIIDDPGGTPASKKITVANLLKGNAITYIDHASVTADQTSSSAEATEQVTNASVTFTPDGDDAVYRFTFQNSVRIAGSGWQYGYFRFYIDSVAVGQYMWIWSRETSDANEVLLSSAPFQIFDTLGSSEIDVDVYIYTANNCQITIRDSILLIERLA